jgi:hypothetical protein
MAYQPDLDTQIAAARQELRYAKAAWKRAQNSLDRMQDRVVAREAQVRRSARKLEDLKQTKKELR